MSEVASLPTPLQGLNWIVVSARLAGSEMVYELCVEAAQFLARYNVRKFESFAEEREEMRRTEEEAAAGKERGQRTLRDIERQAFAAQVVER